MPSYGRSQPEHGPYCRLADCARHTQDGLLLPAHHGHWIVNFPSALWRWYCWAHLPTQHLIHWLLVQGVDVEAIIQKPLPARFFAGILLAREGYDGY